MPTTDQSIISSIVSPSPYIPQTRSFTMTDYTTINYFSFSFGDHPTCPAFSDALNNTYSEPFANTIAVRFFTNARRTTVAPDIITVLREAIIDTVLISSIADRTVVAPIINSMLLFAKCDNPSRKFPLQLPGTVTTAFDANVATPSNYFLIRLNPATFLIDPHNFTVMIFCGTL